MAGMILEGKLEVEQAATIALKKKLWLPPPC
jgi:hypothetical protein